jgi:hypothetical protein
VSFGVERPSSQLQFGPVVTCLYCPSVQIGVQAGHWVVVVTPPVVQLTEPRVPGQLWFTALQVVPVHETLGEAPHKAVQVALRGSPPVPRARLMGAALSTQVGGLAQRKGRVGAVGLGVRVPAAKAITLNSAIMTIAPSALEAGSPRGGAKSPTRPKI